MDIRTAIAAHLATWQAFQDAPASDDHPETLAAWDAEALARHYLLATIPTTADDLLALRQHLDWWVVEEAQRRETEPELFMLHAVILLAQGEAPPKQA